MGSGEDKIGTGVISLSMELDTTATKKMEANLERSISKASRTMRINKAKSRREGVPTTSGYKKYAMSMGPSIGKAMGLGGKVHETGVESTSSEDIKSLSFSVGHLCKHLDKLTAYSKLKKKVSSRLGGEEEVSWGSGAMRLGPSKGLKDKPQFEMYDMDKMWKMDMERIDQSTKEIKLRSRYMKMVSANERRKAKLVGKEEIVLDKEVKKQKSFWDKVAPHLWMRMNSGKVSGGVSANLMAMFTGGRKSGETAGKGTKGGGGEAAAGGALAAGLSVTLLAILGVLMGIWMFVKETEVIKGAINVLIGMVGAFLSPIVMSVALIAKWTGGIKENIVNLYNSVKDFFFGEEGFIQTLLKIPDSVGKFADAFADFAPWFVESLKTKISAMWEGVKESFNEKFTTPVMTYLVDQWYALKRDYITPVTEAIGGVMETIGGNITDAELLVGRIKGDISETVTKAKSFITGLWDGFVDLVTRVKNMFIDKFLNPVGEMIFSVVNYLIDKVNIILPERYEVGNLKWKPYDTSGEAA